MVKTRRQTMEHLADEEERRKMPASSRPPRVCFAPSTTPILKKTSSSSFASASAACAAASSSPVSILKLHQPQLLFNQPAASKKRLCFTPHAPQEFVFETSSPTVRRLRETRSDNVHDSVILQEHLAHGADCPVEIGTKEKLRYQHWLGQDFKRLLREFHHVVCEDDKVSDNDIRGLEDRLRFAESLRRRMEIRRASVSSSAASSSSMFATTTTKLPHELGLAEVQRALLARRVKAPHRLTFAQACEALERSILKEDVQSLVGDGYEFGRRQVSAADLIEFQRLDEHQVTAQLTTTAVAAEGVVAALLPKKPTDRLNLLIERAQLAEECEVRRLMREELDREATRRGLVLPPAQVALDYSAQFDLVFRTNTWRDAYADVNNTPLGEEDESTGTGSACVVS